MKPSNQNYPSSEDEYDSRLSKRKKRQPDSWNQHAVALVIVYRSLGQLLPENYDPDRRSLRYLSELSIVCLILIHSINSIQIAAQKHCL